MLRVAYNTLYPNWYQISELVMMLWKLIISDLCTGKFFLPVLYHYVLCFTSILAEKYTYQHRISIGTGSFSCLRVKN